MSHIALDLVSGARIALGWPLLNRRVSWPLVAMADPWMIGICVTGVIAPLFIASIGSTRFTRPVGARRRSAARFVLAIADAVSCFQSGDVRTGDPPRGSPLSRAERHRSAMGISYRMVLVFERSDGNLRSSAITAGGGPPVVVMSQPLQAESTLVESSRALDTVRNFLAVHEFAFPTEHQDDNQRVSLLWSDLRYCRPETALRSLRCDVWVGGVYDRDGRAITQEVTVGRMVQTRPLPQSGRTRN